ncbi:MAG TPA: hypothetical protein PLB09_05370 [Deltaproteobacteria bacterium]|nr:hypothetical protein [Deltaproteobacteria bacterium]
MRPRILVIGAGMVGSTSAASIASRRLGTVYLHDVVEDLALGRAMDINHSLPSSSSDSRVVGCNTLAEAGRADIVVITAGMARTAGMSRLDLLRSNAAVISSLAPVLYDQCPDAQVLLVTNPVDVLTWHLKSLCPSMHVAGLGCSLDMIRLVPHRTGCGRIGGQRGGHGDRHPRRQHGAAGEQGVHSRDPGEGLPDHG